MRNILGFGRKLEYVWGWYILYILWMATEENYLMLLEYAAFDIFIISCTDDPEFWQICIE